MLLLIPSASYRAPDFMAAARTLGVEVIVGSEQRQALADAVPGRTLTLPLGSPDEAAQAIEDFARERPLAAIVPVDDAGTLAAASAAARLGLPHNAPDAVAATRNKALLRERLAGAGLPSPAWQVAPLAADPRALAASVELPCVLKPLALSGSRGVIRADDREQFVGAFERVRALLEAPAIREECGDGGDRILIEGYIPGVEVSVEGLLSDGELTPLAIFDKPDPLDGPFFEETIYVTPSRLSQKQQDLAVRSAAEAARALGLQHGPLHAELRLNAEGAWPVDVAARSIGGLCARALRFGTGMSLEELLLRHATGAPIASLERTGAASGVMMIPIPAAGVLRSVEGLDAARAVASIEAIEMAIRPGQQVVPLPEGGEYLGFIFARADDPATVEAALREAHRRLVFAIETDAPSEVGTAELRAPLG